MQHVDRGGVGPADAQVRGHKPAAYRPARDVLREALLRHGGAGAGGSENRLTVNWVAICTTQAFHSTTKLFTLLSPLVPNGQIHLGHERFWV